MNEDQQKLDVVEKALARQLAWIASANALVAPLFAIDMAMLTVLAALAATTSHWTVCAAIAPFIAAGVLISSVVYLWVVAFPRLSGPDESIVYFGKIINVRAEDYIKRISAGITAELTEDVARQSYRNAQIADAKYKSIRMAMKLMFIGGALWLIAVALLYIKKIT